MNYSSLETCNIQELNFLHIKVKSCFGCGISQSNFSEDGCYMIINYTLKNECILRNTVVSISNDASDTSCADTIINSNKHIAFSCKVLSNNQSQIIQTQARTMNDEIFLHWFQYTLESWAQCK